MVWALLAVGMVGLILGLRFRVPALFVATLLTAIATIVFKFYSGASIQAALFATVSTLLVLEAAYLIGLLLAFGWSRLRSRQLN